MIVCFSVTSIAEEEGFPLTLPVVVIGREEFEIDALAYLDDSEPKLKSAGVCEALSSYLSEEIMEKFLMASKGHEYLTLDAIRSMGIEVAYDSEALGVQFSVPPSFLGEVDLKVGGLSLSSFSLESTPVAKHSAYVNVSLMPEWFGGKALGRSGFRVGRAVIDGAWRYDSLVLDYAGQIVSNGTLRWRRRYARLVHDLVASDRRVTFGDMNHRLVGYQTGLPGMGLSLERRFEINPNRRPRPNPTTSFTLDSPSSVDVILNGRTVATRQLAYGSYKLRDFGLQAGRNDIELAITDETGLRNSLYFQEYFDESLLRQGLDDYAVGFGVPSVGGSVTDYAWTTPAISGFYRSGVSDHLTLGVNVEGTVRQQLFGADTIWASSLGNFKGESAVSSSAHSPIGTAFRLAFRPSYTPMPGGKSHQWTLATEWQSRGFSLPGTQVRWNPLRQSVSIGYSQVLSDSLGLSTRASYQFNRRPGNDTLRTDLTLSKRWARGFRGKVTARMEQRPYNSNNNSLSFEVGFMWRFDAGRQSLRTGFESRGKTQTLSWNHTPEFPINSLYSEFDLRRSDNGTLAAIGAIDYTSSRSDWRFSQSATFPGRMNPSGSTYGSRFTFGSALAFADGEWALSRPINDSFALVTRHATLSGEPIGIEPRDDRVQARLDYFGNAVVPNLSSYRERRFSILYPENLPVDVDVGPELFNVESRYRSGAVITVGRDHLPSVRGLLVDPQDLPLALVVGSIRLHDGIDSTEQSFFTNRRGVFVTDPLEPGSYVISIEGDVDLLSEIVVPRCDEAQFDAGLIRMNIVSSD